MHRKILLLLAFLLVLPILTQPCFATPSTWNAPASGGTVALTDYYGDTITTKFAVLLMTVTKYSDCTATNVLLYDNASTPNLLANVTFSGNTATFNYNLADGVTYNIVAGNYGLSYTRSQAYPVTLPITTDANINIIKRKILTLPSTWNQQDSGTANINSITTDSNPTNGSITTLWLNNTQGNLTGSYGLTLNATAITNVTGIYVSIFRNNTLIVNATTKAENSTLLGAGFYNITAFTNGNSSISTSQATYWVTISQATSSCTLSFTPSSPITYNATVKPVCICTSPEGTAKMYRNNTDRTSENNTNIILSAGDSLYTCNSTNSQNYTSATASSNYIINKALSGETIYFNTSSLVYTGDIVNATCNSSNAITNDIYNNNAFAGSNSYIYTSLIAGYYYWDCNTTNSNYTSYATQKLLSVYPTLQDPAHQVVYDIAQMTPNQQECSDNNTLEQIYVEPNVTRYILCSNGCDNITNSCSPQEYQQNLLNFVIVIGIIMFFMFLIRWSGRKR